MIGDNVYACSEQALTPFSGPERNSAANDAYNFYIPQLRMRIEMACGMMADKWRILQNLRQSKLKNVGLIFMSITRLHNFCINKCEEMIYFEEGENRWLAHFSSVISITNIERNSRLRDIIITEI